ncbi:hypothetical protein [Streptomyces rubellomurinus]|uniref:Uncharacterized protein n=2 Tax=Streptomyces TaxID=1883 RepID=A0A0F2T8Z3_STRR3|nr:hypothetical protein [Streptomyces rubellomurinus]KJS53597.1 hypothetical protein VM98_24305 [Streptomyces rubellomurinus subsp. indigoferus]KJS58790.1 hypothetical protein VM95_31055 [Streptomyces rubellomurinus]
MTTPPLDSADATQPAAQQPEHPALPTPAQPSRLRRFGRRAWGPALFVVLVAGALTVAGFAEKSEPAAAQAGDCVHDLGNGTKPKMELVDCTKPNADFKVTKVVHDEHDKHPCDSEPDEVFGSYTEERRSSIVTLCLAVNTARPGGPIKDLPSWPAEH